MIYFVTDGDFIKVGHAVSVERRISSLKSGNPKPFTILAVAEGNLQLEKSIHKILPQKTQGAREWFGPSPELLGIIKLINELPLAETSAALRAFVSEQKLNRQRRAAANKALAKKQKTQFKTDCAAVIDTLCKKHGQQKVADASGQTRSAVSFQRRGIMIPGSLALARIGILDPKAISNLIGISKVPKEQLDALPALKEAARELTAYIASIESLRVAA